MSAYRAVALGMLVAAACLAAAAVEPVRRVRSATEAIELAERFVRDQGYSDSQGDARGFEHEFLHSDESQPVSELLKERAGTLEAKAYAYLKDPIPGWFQWWVYFVYLPEKSSPCPELFGVVMLWVPDSETPQPSLMTMHDIRQGLSPDATLLPSRLTSSCSGR